MDWLLDNYVQLGAAIGVIVGGVAVIVKLTPTKKDDKALAVVVRVLKVFGINVVAK